MMHLLIGALGSTAMATLLVLVGWLLAQTAQEERVTAAYEGGKVMQRAVDLARLRQLRCELEEDEEGLGEGEAYLLFDVCVALRLSEGEAQHVLGPAYCLLIEAPVDLNVALDEVDDERGE